MKIILGISHEVKTISAFSKENLLESIKYGLWWLHKQSNKFPHPIFVSSSIGSNSQTPTNKRTAYPSPNISQT